MKTLKTILLIVSFIFVILSCKDDEGTKDFDNTSFNAVIEEGGVPEEVVPEEKELESSVAEHTDELGTTWSCTTRKVSVVDGNSDFPLFNPNASVVYPGSLLQGKTLSSATPSIIPVKRAGGTISIDVIDGNIQPSFSVEEVSKSSVAEAANAIINGSTGVVPANFNFTFEEVQSSKQLSIALGLNVETQFAEVASQFSFRTDKQYNRIVVKLNQSFYTLSFNIPSSPAEIFSPEVTPEDLSQYIGPGNPATFISDVTYGRMYYMLIESTSSLESLNAAVQASFSSATVSGGAEADFQSLSTMSDLEIRVIALGGEATSTFNTISQGEISNLVQMLGEGSDIRAGVPISYVVRSLVSKEIVSVKLATEYEVKTCVAIATPLGSPVAWWRATSLKINEMGCSDCLAHDGLYHYYGPTDSYVMNVGNPDGTVVKKWKQESTASVGTAPGIDASAGNDPLSRPLLVDNAFPNGMPAVEFFRGNFLDYNINNKLTYSGDIFVDTDYTLVMVVSYPDVTKFDVKVWGSSMWSNYEIPNSYGSFMRTGSSTNDQESLRIGFLDKNTFTLSHGETGLTTTNPAFKASPDWKVIAVTFSQTNGMAIYENGLLVAQDPEQTTPLITNPGAMLSAPYPGNDAGFSRIRIAEIRAYAVAGTAGQVQQETVILNKDYGI